MLLAAKLFKIFSDHNEYGIILKCFCFTCDLEKLIEYLFI